MRITNIIFLAMLVFLLAGCAGKDPAIINRETAPLQLRDDEVDYWMRIIIQSRHPRPDVSARYADKVILELRRRRP
jgi:uncharacterized lipoprotein YajG